MKKIRLFSLLLTVLLLVSLLSLPGYAEETEAPEPTDATEILWMDDVSSYRINPVEGAPEYEADCETALLLEMNSGVVIYAKNAEEAVYPASLTKIMTCLVTLQYAGKDLDKIITVSEDALAGIAEAGGEVKLKVGERLTLREALYYLLVSSNNEAGNVIAEYVAGDIPSFVSLMNKTAKELGCTGTHYANTHGLHDSNHYTTARDLSVITRKALTYEVFRDISGTAEYKMDATNLSKARKLVTTNYLLLNDGNRYLGDDGKYYAYYRSDALGIKTGYTSAAGRCIITRAKEDNLDLLCIIMGARTRMMDDGSVRYDNFVEAKRLLSYGFQNFAFAKVAVGGIDPMIQVPVQYAKDKRGVVLIPSADVNCLLPKDYDKEKISTRYELTDPKGLVAPLEKGQKVGTLYVQYDGITVDSTDLETLTAVEEQVVDKTISEIIGKDKTEVEKTTFQKLLAYWYVPLLAILFLVLILILRNAIYRYRRRKALERRRQRAIARDIREAQKMQRTRETQVSQNTRRTGPVNRNERGGRP